MPDLFPKNKKKLSKKQRKEVMRAVSQMTQIAVTVIACVVIGVFLGSFLDRLFGTSPWLLIVFSLLGVGAAFKSLYDLHKRFM